MDNQTQDPANPSELPAVAVPASDSTRNGHLANPHRIQITSDQASATPDGPLPITSDPLA